MDKHTFSSIKKPFWDNFRSDSSCEEDLSTQREKRTSRRRNQSHSDSDAYSLLVSGRKKVVRSHSLSLGNITASYAGSAFNEPPQASHLPPPPLHWQQLKYMVRKSVLVENKVESAKLKMLLESGAKNATVIGVVGGLTPIVEDKKEAEHVSAAVATFFRNYQYAACNDLSFHLKNVLNVTA